MPSKAAGGAAPPIFLATLYYLLQPALKPVLKKTMRRNRWVWCRLQGLRDRAVQAPPPAVGLEAPFVRRIYAGVFYLFGPSLPWLLKRTVGRNSRTWGGLRVLHQRLMHGSRRAVEPAALAAADGRASAFGVNVVGYLSSETGTGEVARTAVRLLRAANIPCVLNNVIGPSAPLEDSASSDFSEENPYVLNLVYVNPDQAANFAWEKGQAYFGGRYNIGVWNWEVSDFPPEWLPRFRYYDEIWAPTRFVADAFSRVSPAPVIRIPYAVDPQPRVSKDFDRSRLGVAPGVFFFLYIFDFQSIFERKNPLGLIEAFKRGFGSDQSAVLIVKSSNADRQAVRMMREAAGPANVKIVDAVLPREALNALYYLCDCYVSLHRAEGFALTPAEAMCAGKPVIATAYGGNTDFMTPENSYLVNYRLQELERDYGPYKKGWTWADPDLDEAAALMRRVFERRDEAEATGRRAREDILRLLHPAVVGGLMKERLLTIADSQGIGVPAPTAAPGRAAIGPARGSTSPG